MAVSTFASLIRSMIYSNVLVSFCVTALTHLSYVLNHYDRSNMYTILIMVFCFTYCTYNLQRIIKFRKIMDDDSLLGERLRWVKKNIPFLKASSIILGLGGLACIYFIDYRCWYLLIPMGGFSLFYVIPIIPFYKKSPSIRQIPYLKIFVIALVWSLVVVGLPFLDSKNTFQTPLYYFGLMFQAFAFFFFVIGITIPFDIRDMDYDKEEHLKTLATKLGIYRSTVLAVILIFFSLCLLLFVSPISVRLGIISGIVITGILVGMSYKKRSELFYSGLIESTVLIVWGSVMVSNLLFGS